jgi:hypothetical protein
LTADIILILKSLCLLWLMVFSDCNINDLDELSKGFSRFTVINIFTSIVDVVVIIFFNYIFHFFEYFLNSVPKVQNIVLIYFSVFLVTRDIDIFKVFT